jgi:hypothetical protein
MGLGTGPRSPEGLFYSRRLRYIPGTAASLLKPEIARPVTEERDGP